MKDKQFIALSGIFFILFLAGITLIAVEKPVSQMLRAKNVSPSPLKSFVTVFPQIGNVGTDIKVSVFMREVNGGVLPNRSVRISASLPKITISPSDTQSTNEIGQAEFALTSYVTGKVIITATDVATNTNIVNIPTVEFVE